MRMLFLSPFPCTLPLRPNTMRLFHWLKYFSCRHDVTLVSFAEAGQKPVLPDGICSRFVTVARRPRAGLMARAANLFAPRPYYLGEHFRSDEMERTVRDLCRDVPFDVAHCSSLAMGQYAPMISAKTKVLEGVDCQARNAFQLSRSGLEFKARAFAWVDWLKLRSYEPLQYSCFDAGIIASPPDRDFLLNLDPALSLYVLPSGVDLEYFAPSELSSPEKKDEIVFAGPMSYSPNRDAAGFFCKEVMPFVLEQCPKAIFRVLGSTVGGGLLPRSAGKSTVFSGHVPDVRPFMAVAGAVVCPLRIGTGIKTKVLEAMAMGKAIVMTPVAAEGIKAVAGKDYLCAVSPREIAASVVRVLSDSGLASALGSSARKAVEKGHDWKAAASRLEFIYKDLLPK